MPGARDLPDRHWSFSITICSLQSSVFHDRPVEAVLAAAIIFEPDLDRIFFGGLLAPGLFDRHSKNSNVRFGCVSYEQGRQTMARKLKTRTRNGINRENRITQHDPLPSSLPRPLFATPRDTALSRHAPGMSSLSAQRYFRGKKKRGYMLCRASPLGWVKISGQFTGGKGGRLAYLVITSSPEQWPCHFPTADRNSF
jgi:hypothetical protein